MTISTFFDGELSHEDLMQVGNHVKRCFNCKKILDEVEAVSSTIKNSSNSLAEME